MSDQEPRGHGARKDCRIPEPKVGMVIVENDPRGALPKRIVATDPWFVYTQAGRDGSGRRSRILSRRLKEGRYTLLSPSPHANAAGEDE